MSLQSKGKAIESRIASFIHTILKDFGVIASGVARVVYLSHLKGSSALVHDIAYLLNASRMLCTGKGPAAGCSGVAEALCGADCQAKGE